MKLPNFGQRENALMGKASASDRVLYENARLDFIAAANLNNQAELNLSLIDNDALRGFARAHLQDNAA